MSGIEALEHVTSYGLGASSLDIGWPGPFFSS
jgi:hypothetical protein